MGGPRGRLADKARIYNLMPHLNLFLEGEFRSVRMPRRVCQRAIFNSGGGLYLRSEAHEQPALSLAMLAVAKAIQEA